MERKAAGRRPRSAAKPAAKVAKKGSALSIQRLPVADASLKAIAARYEVLHQRDLIPKELKPQALPEKDPESIDPLLSQWVEWLDAHLEHSLEGTENFVFESNRALYGRGQIRRAVERMSKFSIRYPKSTYAIPQASLVLDTYIASWNWERTHQVATEFMEVAEWKQGEFGKRLFAVAASRRQVYKTARGPIPRPRLQRHDQRLRRVS